MNYKNKFLFSLFFFLFFISSVSGLSLWSTNNGCGPVSGDVVQYNIENAVYLNGNGFSSGNYSWEIRGKAGSASCDPNIVVASGKQFVTNSQNFCFNAYNVSRDDCGEYQVKFARESDTYRVSGAFCSQQSQCGVTNSQIICFGSDLYNITYVPSCTNEACSVSNSSTFVRHCDGICSQNTCFEGTEACTEALHDGLVTGTIRGTNAMVKNNANISIDVGLAIYRIFPGGLKKQSLFDSDTATVLPHKNASLSVEDPSCNYQLDLFCGPVVPVFNGSTYGSKLITAGFPSDGTTSCQNQTFCGNGIKEAGEQCDDGNKNNADSCSNQCIILFSQLDIRSVYFADWQNNTLSEILSGERYLKDVVYVTAESDNIPDGTEATFEIYEDDVDAGIGFNDDVIINGDNSLKGVFNNGIVRAAWNITVEDYNKGNDEVSETLQFYTIVRSLTLAKKSNNLEVTNNSRIDLPTIPLGCLQFGTQAQCDDSYMPPIDEAYTSLGCDDSCNTCFCSWSEIDDKCNTVIADTCLPSQCEYTYAGDSECSSAGLKKITYKGIPVNGFTGECSDKIIEQRCAQSTLLPFFGMLQFIITLMGITLTYIFIRRFGKK